jgi:hypothetical protein
VLADGGVDAGVVEEGQEPDLLHRHVGRGDRPGLDDRQERPRPLLAAEQDVPRPRLCGMRQRRVRLQDRVPDARPADPTEHGEGE